jgi:hypothetical protein
MHADTIRSYVARQTTDYLEQNGMKRASHPPYSLDLTPADFYLFGHVKDIWQVTHSRMHMSFLERFNEFWRVLRKWYYRWFFSIESKGSKNVLPPMESMSNDLKQRLLMNRFLLAQFRHSRPEAEHPVYYIILYYITSDTFEWVKLISNHFHWP